MPAVFGRTCLSQRLLQGKHSSDILDILDIREEGFWRPGPRRIQSRPAASGKATGLFRGIYLAAVSGPPDPISFGPLLRRVDELRFARSLPSAKKHCVRGAISFFCARR
jgi:hypothetical protein